MPPRDYDVAVRGTRALATHFFNDRNDLSTHDALKKANLKVNLDKLTPDLEQYHQIMNKVNFEQNQDDTLLDTDYQTCQQYQDRIITCLHLLAEVAPAPITNIDVPRSLLKSPQAPLPTFKREANENFESYIHT